MNSYQIYEWNTYLFPNTVNPVPMIFIKEELANVLELDLRIQNTSSEYDGKPYRGTVLNKKNKDYTAVVLDSKWYGYPDSLGEMSVSKTAHQIIQSDESDESGEKGTVKKTVEKLSKNLFILLFVILFLLFLSKLI
jgi:hypothetical protein